MSNPLTPARKLSTRAELEALRAERERDLEHLRLDHPSPSQLLGNPEDPKRVQMRMRERRIRFLEEKLFERERKLDRDFGSAGRNWRQEPE